MRFITSLFVVMLMSSAVPRPAIAQGGDSDASCVEVMHDREVQARYAFLEEELQEGVRPSRWWHWGWLALTFGAVGLQATIAAMVTDREVQVASAYGVIGPFLAMMTHLNGPLPGVFAMERLGEMPAQSVEARRARLYEAESLLDASVARERWERGWFPFASMAVLPTAIGGAIWFGYDYPWSALRVGLTNVAGSLGRIFTYPQWASRALERYRARFRLPLCEADLLPRETLRVRVQLVPAPGGAGVRLTF